MKITKTLNWSQLQAAEGAVRCNVTTAVQDDAGNVVSTAGEDISVTTPAVVAAYQGAQQQLATALDLVLPPVA